MPDTPVTAGSDANDIPERLIDATIALLATEGPSAVKARSVAAAAGMSTMVVYNYFGGVPELVNAVVERGFRQIEEAFAEVPVTEDAIADLFTMALTTLKYARANPHLYDAMFGLSGRATYRPSAENGRREAGHSPTFQEAYRHVTDACERLGASGPVAVADPSAVAGALWSFVHGYIMLELAHHFAEFDDPVRRVLLPMGVTFCVGLGAHPAAALRSHEAALERVIG
ncbi:TetR/AcrR family transcriptional regulator [Gordonia sp. TBRC 11910]|uniref:TetR/AcrR family transcriptional regulator n=1 Tax=Gordonia asplenii TaxID=2725283 RepID=A0A848KWX5_9ACTN|nr:TetR/AcrR family transcriptional regulator [Gordonia asplenii]NMO02742.1 TetR/AcrR family transcriptional regulator [Gordonia asplenii]